MMLVEVDVWLIVVFMLFKGDYELDMIYVELVVCFIVLVLKKGVLVIFEFILLVGLIEKMVEWLVEMCLDFIFLQQVGEQVDVNIVYCLECVLSGQVMVELIKNDCVIGGMMLVCLVCVSELYKIFFEGECVVINLWMVEMCKFIENSFCDVNIVFVNELLLICVDQGINVWELICLVNCYFCVNIFQSGFGVGGYCIVVDLWFIVVQNFQQVWFICIVCEVNDYKLFWVIDQVKVVVVDCLVVIDKCVSELKIVCFGLVFKLNIDDLCESLVMEIVELIVQWYSGEILVVEFNIYQLLKKLIGFCILVQFDEVLVMVDVLVMLVDYSQFKVINGDNVYQQYVVDVKGVWC